MKILSSIFVTLVLTSAGHAQTASIRFHFEAGRAMGQLTPVPFEDSYDCDAPSIPAEIVLSHKLEPSLSHLSLFLQTDVTKRRVTVRRGGQVEQSLNDGDFQPRFSHSFYSREQQIAATDMSLSMTLSFCEYKGFLEFVGADYVLSGQVGNFRVYHHEILGSEAREAFSMTYRSRNWTSSDGGQFSPPYGFGYHTIGNILGVLHLTLNLEAEPFELVEGEGQLPVDITVWPTILVTRMGESP